MSRPYAAVVFALTVGSAGALAQERPPVQSVTLHISVTDIYTRGYLPGATIEVTNNATGAKVSTVTGPNRRVSVTVTPGSYRVAISLSGYEALVDSNFCVVAGTPASFEAVLGPTRRGQRRGGPPPLVRQPDPTIVLAPRSVPSQSVMTDVEIREAMAHGRRGTKLTGYPLTGSRGLERWSIGHLFTPFLRLATMTQLADATNKPFTESEIPRQLLERVAWVVATPGEYSEYTDDGRVRWVIEPRDIVIQSQDAGGRQDIKPPWKIYLKTQCDADVFESLLGRQFPRPGMVAAFPMDAIHPGNRIAVTYSAIAAISIGASTRRVNIREEDLRSWK